jgi:hypothetical protein
MVKTMNAILRPLSMPAAVEADTASQRRCNHTRALLLAHRGYPSVEVERLLADDHIASGNTVRNAAVT